MTPARGAVMGARVMRVLAFATILALATFGKLTALVAVDTFCTAFTIAWASCAFVMWRGVRILCSVGLRDFLSVGPKPFSVTTRSDGVP